MRSVVAVAWLGVWACVLTPVATTLCSYVAAVYWALATLTSVGYGDISAVTNLGRSPCGGDLVAPWTMSNVLAAWHRDGVLDCGHGSWLVVGGFHCWQHHVHRRVAGPCFGEKAPAHRRRGEVNQVRRLYILRCRREPPCHRDCRICAYVQRHEAPARELAVEASLLGRGRRATQSRWAYGSRSAASGVAAPPGCVLHVEAHHREEQYAARESCCNGWSTASATASLTT